MNTKILLQFHLLLCVFIIPTQAVAQEVEWNLSESDVGVGTGSPRAKLHVVGKGVGGVVPDTERVLLLESSLAPEQVFKNTTSNAIWYFAMVSNDDFKISFDGTGKVEARFKPNGNLIIAGNLSQNSDVNGKKNILEVDSKDILEKVVGLPVSSWEYKADSGVKHVGPMAQDFYEAFGLGESPTTISTIDTGGVALAAIKGLKQEKDSQIEQLKVENNALRSKLEQNESRMVALETALAEILKREH